MMLCTIHIDMSNPNHAESVCDYSRLKQHILLCSGLWNRKQYIFTNCEMIEMRVAWVQMLSLKSISFNFAILCDCWRERNAYCMSTDVIVEVQIFWCHNMWLSDCWRKRSGNTITALRSGFPWWWWWCQLPRRLYVHGVLLPLYLRWCLLHQPLNLSLCLHFSLSQEFHIHRHFSFIAPSLCGNLPESYNYQWIKPSPKTTCSF